MDIKLAVTNGPELILEREKEVIRLNAILEAERTSFEITEAELTIEYQNEKNQKLIEAKIKADPRWKSAREAVHEARKNVDTAKALLTEIENAFAAGRKLMGSNISLGEIPLSSEQ